MTELQQEKRLSELITLLRAIREAYECSTDPELDAWLKDCWHWLTTHHSDLLRLYWYMPFDDPYSPIR